MRVAGARGGVLVDVKPVPEHDTKVPPCGPLAPEVEAAARMIHRAVWYTAYPIRQPRRPTEEAT
jgi:hypothetical protein